MPSMKLTEAEIAAAIREHLERRLLGVQAGLVTISAENVAGCCEPPRWRFSANVELEGVALSPRGR